MLIQLRFVLLLGIEDNALLRTPSTSKFEVLKLGNLFRFCIFCYSVQLKYAGTAMYDSQKIPVDIFLAPSKLKKGVYSSRVGNFLYTERLVQSFYRISSSFHPKLTHCLFAWPPCFFIRCFSSYKKPLNSGATFYLTSLPSPYIFRKNRH